MQIIAKRTLRQFWEKHGDAEKPLRSWYAAVASAKWLTSADIKAQFGSANFVGDNRVIFNIGGNKYRLIAWVAYGSQRVLIKCVGTHAQYESLEAATVGHDERKKKNRPKGKRR